jgi:nicotinamide mononucleotide transporter
MYVYKGLYPTALLYAVFLILAIMGLIEWRKSLARDRAVAPHPEPTSA